MNLNNILIITGDSNIRDNNWDLLYLYHLTYTGEIADSFNLELSLPINQGPTQYIDNP